MPEQRNLEPGPAEQDQREVGGTSDGALVDRFVTADDSIAFEILVRRHGPMVLGVCRRLLRHEQDAEDAFQAAFLVLHRKAHSIRATSRLANWLYGVAFRTALKAKSARHSMRTRELQVESLPEPQTTIPDECWRGLEPLLDQELSKLPEKYRLPIVMCELEGMSLKEAARQLRWPEGTISARLSRGRTLLRDRLSRHGTALSLAALSAGLAHHAAAASVPTTLLDSTIQGATLLASGQAGVAGACSANVATLTKGVLKSMFLAKLKFVAATAVVTTMIGTGVLVAAQDPAGPGDGGAVAQALAPAPAATPAEQPPRDAFVPLREEPLVAEGQGGAGAGFVTVSGDVVITKTGAGTLTFTNGQGNQPVDAFVIVNRAAALQFVAPAEEASADDPPATVEPTHFRGTVSMVELTEADKEKLQIAAKLKLAGGSNDQANEQAAREFEEKVQFERNQTRFAQEQVQGNENAADANAPEDE